MRTNLQSYMDENKARELLLNITDIPGNWESLGESIGQGWMCYQFVNQDRNLVIFLSVSKEEFRLRVEKYGLR